MKAVWWCQFTALPSSWKGFVSALCRSSQRWQHLKWLRWSLPKWWVVQDCCVRGSLVVQWLVKYLKEGNRSLKVFQELLCINKKLYGAACSIRLQPEIWLKETANDLILLFFNTVSEYITVFNLLLLSDTIILKGIKTEWFVVYSQNITSWQTKNLI